MNTIGKTRNTTFNARASYYFAVVSSFFVLCGGMLFYPVQVRAQTHEQEAFQLEEVVVTARKREESLQDTPVAISAFTAQDLKVRQISATTDLGDITPNLTFDAYAPSAGSNSTSQIFIRGIGQVDFTAVTDPGVGLYVDGVYYARSVGSAIDFLDIERVEVLRGPQGTLFGRNTIGGAVLLYSSKPESKFGGSIEGQVGSDDMLNFTGSVNIPLHETLLSKFTFGRRGRDGYVTRVADGTDLGDEDRWGGRAQFLWTPNESFEAMVNFDYTKERENGAPNVSLGINDQQTFAHINNIFAPSCPLTPPPAPPGPGRDTANNPGCANLTAFIGPFNNGGTAKTLSELDYWGVNLTATWEVNEFLTTKSITSYRELDSAFARDADGTAFLIFHTEDTFDHDQFSQEIQLSGRASDNRLQWLLGFYYFEEEANNPNPVFFPPLIGAFTSGGSTDNDNYAIFTQATYNVTDALSLTLGLRYTDETKRFTPLSVIDILPYFNPVDGVIPVGSRLVPAGEVAKSFDDITPMANIAYRWSDDLMTYFNYSEGFKSGGFDQRYNQIFPAVSGFGPEKATTYEIGFKSTLLSNQLRFNAAFFSTDYKDMQIIVREGFAPITFNAGKSTIKGFELEATFVPNGNLLIQGSIGYIDAGYDTLTNDVLTKSPIRKNFAFPQTPEWSTALGIAYSIPVSDWGKLTPRLDWYYKSSVFNDAINTPQLKQDGYHLLNAALSLESNDGKWEFVLAGRNLTDELYLITGNSAFNTGASYLEGIYARKSEWSLSAKYNF